MRINISIDLGASEIDLANDIISTLKGITTNISVNKLDPQSDAARDGAPSTDVKAQQSPSAQQPNPERQHSNAPSATSQQQPGRYLQTAPSQNQQSTPAQQQQPQQQPKQHGAPNGGMPAVDYSNNAFQPLIWQLGKEETYSDAVHEIIRLLVSGGPKAVETFTNCFQEVVFKGQIKDRRESVVPYVQALADIQPEQIRESVRDKITPPILKYLATKRALDVDRYEVFPHAEAFATLVQRGLLTIQGAVKTICVLLASKDKRVAAITIMGKTAELCYDQLTRDCPPELVTQLQEALAKCTEDIFEADLEYINEAFSWGSQVQTMRGVGSWTGAHTERIFALAYDPVTARLISGSRDCKVVAWDQVGRIAGQPQTLQDCFVCALDFDTASNRLLVAGVPRKGATLQSNVAGFTMTPDGLVAESTLFLKDTKVLSQVRVLPEAGGFAIGRGTKNQEHVIDFYETARANSSVEHLEATTTFKGHTDVVSALEQYPDQPDLFLSGARDGQVLLWDQRSASTGHVGAFASSSTDTGNMVTCIQALGHTLLSGNKDLHVNEWDLRMTSSSSGAVTTTRSLRIDDTVVLKLAIGGSLSKVAVSTFSGLYNVDFSVQGNPAMEKAIIEGTALADRDVSAHYHDIKWVPGTNTLHAAGAGVCIDTYTL